jgi:hypothetical protein
MLQNIDGAHAVIVPSKWNAECFSAQGLNTPVYVVPLGFNENIFVKKSLTPREGPFIFGAAGNPSVSVSQRKNLDGVVDAFTQAFPSDPDVRLRIKVLPNCQVPLHADSRVEIIREIITEEALAEWTRSLDVFVTAARGEAFGFFNLQAMASGVPVISPLFGGVREYLNESNCFPVDYVLVPPRITHYNTGLWAEPSMPSLIRQMRTVRERGHAYILGLVGWEAAQKFTWRSVTERLVSVLQASNFWETYQPDSGRQRRRQDSEVLPRGHSNAEGACPDLSEKALTNTPRGLGDTLLFSHLPYVGACQGKPSFIHANPEEHRHFATLMKYNPLLRPEAGSLRHRGGGLLTPAEVDMGNGHFMQRLQRAFGLEPVLKPQPYLYYPGPKSANRVVLHFEAGGPHGNWQKAKSAPARPHALRGGPVSASGIHQ